MAMELTAEELREAINKTDDYLFSPELCGVPEYQTRFHGIVSKWLSDAATG
jgi:hypothetical protein